MKKVIAFALTLVVVSLTACAPSLSVAESSKDRITSPAVAENDLETLVEGNNTFAFDLYQSLKEAPGNIFYSPYSISAALAMTYAGARGETERQMGETLRFTLPQDRLHPAFNSVALALASRGKDTGNQDLQGFRLNNINALWGQKDYNFLPAFLDVLAQNYGAGMRILDFVRAPEDSRLTINKWVNDETESRIPDLLPKESITSATALVLTNAIYFKAAWFYQFDDTKTSPGEFQLLDGSKVAAPMMRLSEYLNYAEGDGYQALELLYRGNQLSMVILMPDAGEFDRYEKALQYSPLKPVLDNFDFRTVLLAMPKFKYSSEFMLKKTLGEMGMPVAFTGGADLSGMTGNRDLFISDVYHDAFVAVDEKGTEAAAATAVAIARGASGGPVTFTIDRPFIFLIRDIKTGAVLFIGRVLNPLE